MCVYVADPAQGLVYPSQVVAPVSGSRIPRVLNWTQYDRSLSCQPGISVGNVVVVVVLDGVLLCLKLTLKLRIPLPQPALPSWFFCRSLYAVSFA